MNTNIAEKHYLQSFIKYVSLNILGMLSLSFYILADTFFVANGCGADGLAALNLSIPAFNIANGFGLMMGMGGGIRYAIAKARDDQAAMNRIFTNALIGAFTCAALCVMLSFFFSDRLAILLGADEATYDMTHTYLKVILLFSVGYIPANTINAFVRNDGDPLLAAMGTTTGCLMNVLLDYIFIFPMHMGILGAVLATGFAPLCNLIILSVHFIFRENHLHLTRMLPDPRLLFSIIRLGLPSLITETSSGIVIIIFNLIILGLTGNAGVAAYGVIANLALVVLALFTGIANGMQPLVSTSYSQGDHTGQKIYMRYALILMMMISLPAYILICLFNGPITSLFNSEANTTLQHLSEQGLVLYFAGAPFMGFNIVSNIYLASIEKAKAAQVISLLRGIALISPIVYLFSLAFGMTGVWLATPATEILVAIFAFLILIRQRKV